MEKNSVAEPKRFSRFQRRRTFHVEGRAGPAIITTVPTGRIIWIAWVVEESDACPFARRNWAGLIEPLGVFEVRVLFIAISLRVYDFTAAIEDSHGLCDSSREKSEGSLPKAHGFWSGWREFGFKIEHAKIFVRKISGYVPAFMKKIFRADFPPRLLDEPAKNGTVFHPLELFMSNDAAAFGPEIVAVHVRMRDPQRVMMRMTARRIVRLAEFS